MQTVQITASNADRRLDKFLFQYLNAAPENFIYKMLRKKNITLNEAKAKGAEIIQAGDVLQLYLSDETIEKFRKTREIAPAKPLTGIIFEDDHLLVVNKPAGLPSHGGMEKKDDHLLGRVLAYLVESGAYDPSDSFVPALCNRLDVNTSGIVICGKTLHALQSINALFAGQGIDKEYLTIVDGELGRVGKSRVLRGFYKKDVKTNRAKIFSTSDPQSPVETIATTAYTVLAISRDASHSLVSVNPITGRSHQIRAHMAAIGHPLTGDKKYGGSSTNFGVGQLLHCHRVSIPTQDKSWEAPPPKSFKKCIDEWFGDYAPFK